MSGDNIKDNTDTKEISELKSFLERCLESEFNLKFDATLEKFKNLYSDKYMGNITVHTSLDTQYKKLCYVHKLTDVCVNLIPLKGLSNNNTNTKSRRVLETLSTVYPQLSNMILNINSYQNCPELLDTTYIIFLEKISNAVIYANYP